MRRLFSVRMRSSKEGVHISGAERIVPEDLVEEVVSELYRRAVKHSRGRPDFISIKVEELREEPLLLKSLPVYEVNSSTSAERVLSLLFRKAGVPELLGMSVYRSLLEGPSPSGGVMRGAMVVTVPSGRRVEPDRERGVRASFLDISDDVSKALRSSSGKKFTQNLKEALTLSTKILSYPGVIGELCVSDDPEYTTGYFSISSVGYFRIFNVKPFGCKFGGRAIFVSEDIDVQDFINFLEKRPVIVSEFSGYSVVSLSEIEEKFPDLT